MFYSKHTIQFKPVDPLANGLADDIQAEQREAEAIRSFDDTSADELATFWSGVVRDVKNDPDWFDFAED